MASYNGGTGTCGPFKSRKKQLQLDFELMLLQTGLRLKATAAGPATDEQGMPPSFTMAIALGTCIAAMRKHGLPFPVEDGGWAMKLVAATPGSDLADYYSELMGTLIKNCQTEHQVKTATAMFIAPEYVQSLERSQLDGYRLVS